MEAHRAAGPLPWMLLLTFINAVCFPALKTGLAFAPPLLFAGLRAVLGGLALLGWAAARREAILPRGTSWGSIAVLALTSTTIVFAAMFLTADRMGAGIASILGNLQALFTIGLASAFLGERWSGRKTTALVLGLAGVTLIAFPTLAGTGPSDLLGPVLALTVSAGSALSNILVKRLRIESDLLAVTAWQLIAGCLPLLAGSALFERGSATDWNGEFLLLLLFLGLAGTSFVTATWYWLIQREDVGRLSIFFYLVPPFGLGFALLAFKEPLNGNEIAGSFLALAGVALTVLRTKR